jgi:hypothetical protein
MDVPGINTGEFLAMPLIKGTMNMRYTLNRHWGWYFAIVGQSGQYSFELQPDGYTELVAHSSSVLVNSGFLFNSVKWAGISASVGVSNIFNQMNVASSPFNNEVASMPLLARQFTLKLSYLLK